MLDVDELELELVDDVDVEEDDVDVDDDVDESDFFVELSPEDVVLESDLRESLR